MAILRQRGQQRKPPMVLDGTLIVLGVPAHFPPMLAAVMHLASAVTKRKAFIRVERFDGVISREFKTEDVYRFAQAHRMCQRELGVTWPEDFDPRIQNWPGSSLSEKELSNG